MSYILPVFLFYMVLVASAQHTHEDVGEYGNYNTWRKAVCEKNDQEMYKEMDACFKLEHKNVQDASEECAKKAYPESEGKVIPFVNAACKDRQLFIEVAISPRFRVAINPEIEGLIVAQFKASIAVFDTCFEEYEANSAFREQMELTPEIQACYDKVLKKYKMGDIRTILKDWPLSNKSR